LAWLYTIARNLIADYHRSADRTVELVLDEQVVADTIHPESAAELGLTQDKLASALTHLTEEQRQVVILKFIEGYDNKSVAQMLGKPVGAVKSLQHRALASLRRILTRDEG
jgi:RNA polymerase sigma-70 factor (ECF subfamily)